MVVKSCSRHSPAPKGARTHPRSHDASVTVRSGAGAIAGRRWRRSLRPMAVQSVISQRETMFSTGKADRPPTMPQPAGETRTGIALIAVGL